METMLIIGLGNPGSKYRDTRHNTGFKVIEEFARENNFPEFKLSKKFNSLTSEHFLSGKKIILAKPQTFMNESGKPVKSLAAFYKAPETALLVISDDIDIPLKKIKIVRNRGSAGHKGVESIISELGNKDFTRIRIGIRPDKENQMEKPEKFVVGKFRKEEENILKKIRKKAVKIIKSIIVEGPEKTMTEFNQ